MDDGCFLMLYLRPLRCLMNGDSIQLSIYTRKSVIFKIAIILEV